ncbi:MAG TPA: indole-3-glycerol phosphate synthase TrpC [Dehalococcoidia bacterium]|nr:indole-3-glycerol phosphate synthase TrpC [Dehalococcoidia bacterium]
MTRDTGHETRATETVLDRIVAEKREELAAAKRSLPPAQLRAEMDAAPPLRPFAEAIRGDRIRLIAEVKKRSPSRGLLRADFEPVSLARTYAEAGAAAISVLTDERNFGGSLAHLRSLREALPAGPPLLRKDFLFDPYQVYEARANGADAVLLIAAILEPGFLAELIALAGSLGMAALVEVHDEAETATALSAGAAVIGINDRDLRTFEVDLRVTERLRPLVPAGKAVVAESGVFTRADVERLEGLGVQAVLIGEALVTAADPGAKIRELMGE